MRNPASLQQISDTIYLASSPYQITDFFENPSCSLLYSILRGYGLPQSPTNRPKCGDDQPPEFVRFFLIQFEGVEGHWLYQKANIKNKSYLKFISIQF